MTPRGKALARKLHRITVKRFKEGYKPPRRRRERPRVVCTDQTSDPYHLYVRVEGSHVALLKPDDALHLANRCLSWAMRALREQAEERRIARSGA